MTESDAAESEKECSSRFEEFTAAVQGEMLAKQEQAGQRRSERFVVPLGWICELRRRR